MTNDRRRAVLINLNAETDFVAKGDPFKEFLANTLKLLLDSKIDIDLASDSSNIESFLTEVRYDTSNTLDEARRLLTAKTKEKIEFGQIKTVAVDASTILGCYIHKELLPAIGSSGCWLSLQHASENPDRSMHRIADNLAVHYFGNKSECLYETEIDRLLYEENMAEVKRSLGNALENKPQDLQEKMIRGKMTKFLQERAMDCQRVGFEESDLTIGEYLKQAEKTHGPLRMTSASRFGV